MKRKIFITSLHRTATQSTHLMLKAAGLKSIHWPHKFNGEYLQELIRGNEQDLQIVADRLSPLLDECDAVSDVPIPALYEILHEKYPGSSFVTVSRPASDWTASVRKHIGTARPFSPFEKVVYWRYLKNLPNAVTQISDEEMRFLQKSHHDGINDFFNDKENHLFIELSDALIGKRICDFLGIEPLDFPKFDYLTTRGPAHGRAASHG